MMTDPQCLMVALLREARTAISVLLDTAADFTETDKENCRQALDLLGRIDAALPGSDPNQSEEP